MLYVVFLYLAIGTALAATASRDSLVSGAGRPITPIEEITVRVVFALVWLPVIAAIIMNRRDGDEP